MPKSDQLQVLSLKFSRDRFLIRVCGLLRNLNKQQEFAMQVLVTGGGGIGRALIARIIDLYPNASIVATWHSSEPRFEHRRLRWQQVDLTVEDQIVSLAGEVGKPDWVINAAGLLHTESVGPEKSIRAVDPEFFMDNLRINTLPTLLLAKHFNRRFSDNSTGVFATISARVGSIEDNRLGGWTSYRCAKAALNMALKNISIEWSRTAKNVAVVALHPGTTDTELSQPFQAAVKPEKLFTPEKTASLLVDVIAGLTPEQTGQFLAYDGSRIPW